ncbi:hypothetical protein COV58_03450 [Candidatus Roizmanbacteria bacterium CG11_big_fil_rev_8_21_14_0_20_36_8]|uniref:Serine protease n=2 Tax=Candidatus Roizmaniibacteriota TaxID=1752723 RepID=A0A2M6ITS5_9BACT|nr:MAG: hypothetical protein COV58_03450 [Candidatus Roizmanbacteria bacterium CG11_big_fil_rev_8_21_14_0_20_36_8]PIZ65184.1 MAG: hypothetical protein COY14_02980 [Candidatus Roizmanbacteria bacterium CG_4_10_14_0_2_um_filter_36_9]
MDYFEKASKKIKLKQRSLIKRLRAYFKRLLFPLRYFPLKLVTYSAYYLVKFAFLFVFSLIKILFETIIFPFKSLKNLLKSIFIIGVVLYIITSLFVITDYLRTQYGYYGKFFCTYGAKERLQKSVVRIVGGNSEGTGFFISKNRVLTNFHVIADEPAPKIIFPDGSFVTPAKMVGDSMADLAILYIEEEFPDLAFSLPDSVNLIEDEPVLSTGYPMGTDLSGEATTLKGSFIDYRKSKNDKVGYIQTSISLVSGMSGGPLTDQCGELIGVNTMGLAGISLFIRADNIKEMTPYLTEVEIAQIAVDPSISPEESVRAFYTYLKARRMEDGFTLLSEDYLQKTDFEEWTNRFTDILDVDVVLTERYEDTDDTAYVKFITKNWNDGEVDYHYYEGTWTMVVEDGVYKIRDGNIQEVFSPEWDWFY